MRRGELDWNERSNCIQKFLDLIVFIKGKCLTSLMIIKCYVKRVRNNNLTIVYIFEEREKKVSFSKTRRRMRERSDAFHNPWSKRARFNPVSLDFLIFLAVLYHRTQFTRPLLIFYGRREKISKNQEIVPPYYSTGWKVNNTIDQKTIIFSDAN